MNRPDAYSAPVTDIRHIETHIAHVFLAGDRAYKLKKPVTLGYLDFSTLDRRKRVLDRELHLNRRTAPDIYRDVVPITREMNGSILVNGKGEIVEWALEMARFDETQVLDRLARTGACDLILAEKLAVAIADFHERAAVSRDVPGPDAVEMVIRLNQDQLTRHIGDRKSVV